MSSSTSSNPGRTWHGYQDPERHVLDDRTGQPVEMSRSDYLQKDHGRSWSSQEWKSRAAEHDRSGKPEDISWNTLQEVDPHREEYLLGRNAHSARYGETIHDRTGQFVSENLQEQAHFENFIMGSDVTEFCGSSQRPSANSTEKQNQRETVELPSTIPMNERKWIDIESAESSLSLRTRSRRKSSIFFDTVKRYNEKMTEQLISGESKNIFRVNSHKFLIGLTIDGKHVWH